MEHHEDLDNFIDEMKGKQRNIVFPDTVRNQRGMYAFLWRGSPHPTLVQRIAAGILGLFFLAQGIAAFSAAARANKATSWISALVAVPWILIAAKILRNGFRNRNYKSSAK